MVPATLSRSPSIRRVAAITRAVVVALATATCGLDTLTGSGDAVQLALQGDSLLVVGATLQLAPQVQGGAALTGVHVQWLTSAPAIATVDGGVVTGRQAGTVTISAIVTAPELKASGESLGVALRVRFAGIVMSPVDSLTGLGQSVVPVVNGSDAAGAAAGGVTATITSSDPTVIAVVGGSIVARRNGTAIITAAFDGYTDQKPVKVRQVANRVVFGSTPFVFRALARDTGVAVTVLDTRDSVIASPVIAWSSLNAAVATVSLTGVMRALQLATTTIRAVVDTAVGSLPVSVSQAPAALAKSAGDNQTQTAGAAVATLPTVTVSDAGGVPIAGAAVTFSVASGGGSITGAAQTTDAAGKATVGSWTLGTTSGANALLATVGTLSATFGATGAAGPATKLVIQQAPSGTNGVGAVLAPALQVTVRDANNNLVTTATTAITVALAANPGSATLGGTATVSAVAGVAAFGDLTISAPGAGYTLAASATGLTGATTAAFTVVGPAAKLAFTVQPSNVVAGASIAPAIQVSVQDAAGNTIAGATNAITLAIGTNPGSGTLTGGGATAASSGVASFAGVSVDKSGAGYTLTASASGLTAATSATFTVSAGAASMLVFRVQPSNTSPATAMTPAVQVAVTDALGNTVTTSTATVTMAIGTNPVSGTLSGTTSVAAVAGVASFATLQISTAGNGYTLAASATGLTGATSGAFNIVGAGTPRALKFVTQPSIAVAGVSIAPAITVKVVDSVGTTVNSSTASISLSFGANPNSGTLSGTVTVNAVAGVATFSTAKVNRAGGGYTLAATSAGLTPDTSTSFTVGAGTASALAFSVQPTSVVAGAAIAPAVQVSVTDNQGNVVTSSTASIALAIGANPGTSTLTGGAAVAASNGVASFAGLSLNKAANSYTLSATSTGLTAATSSAFNVTAGAPAVLAITTQPTNAAVGAVLTTVAVTVRDASGNTVTTATTPVSLALAANAAGATLGGTATVAAVNGIASFTTLTLDKPGQAFTLQATATGLTPATTNVFNAIGPATALFITSQPTNTIRNGVIANVVVEGRDAAGNKATGAANPVTLAIGTNPNAGTLGGTLVRNLAAGVATFTGLMIDSAGTGYTLQATATGLTAAVSSAFDITAFGAAAKLAFLTQPNNADAGAIISPVVRVLVQDAQGNTVTNSSAAVTLSLGGPSSTLGGTASVNAASGVASFSDLTVGTSGTGYILTASGSGLASVNSASFTVTVPGAAQRLRFDVQPSNTIAGSSIAPAIVVSAVNSSNAIVTSATGTITLAVDSGPAGATLSTQVSLVNGQATFSSAQLTVAGNYYLRASGAGLTQSVSQLFTINSGNANKLVFLDIPGTTVAGTIFPAPIRVAVTDQFGNIVPAAANQIRVQMVVTFAGIGGCGIFNPVGSALFGTGVGMDGDTVKNATSGVATFVALRPRSWYSCQGPFSANNILKLYATSVGLTDGITGNFTLLSAPPVRLAFYIPPPATVTARVVFNSYVMPVDSLGNWAALGNEVVSVALSTSPSGAHITGTTSGTAGALSYALVSPAVDSLGNYVLTATAPGLAPVNTSVFTANAGAAAQLGFVVPPANTQVGASISPAVRVCVLDPYLNEVRTATGSLTIAIGTNPGSATLGGTKTVTLSSGCANFTDLTLSAIGTGYTLSVTPTGVTGVSGAFISSTFNITP